MTGQRAWGIWATITLTFFVVDWVTHPNPGDPLLMLFIAGMVAYLVCLITMACWHAWQTVQPVSQVMRTEMPAELPPPAPPIEEPRPRRTRTRYLDMGR